MISAIEEAGKELWKSGAVASWYADADRQVAAVSRTVNGPLLEYLAEVHDYLPRSLALFCVCNCQAISYEDAACIQFFREGAPIIGELPYSGNGTRLLVTQDANIEGLLERAPIGNLRILEKLREDPHARKLHQACEADAELGRMAAPMLAATEHCTDYVLSPRFSVEQGHSSAASCMTEGS